MIGLAKLARALPVLIVAEAALAAVGYALEGEWRRAFYWGASAAVTLAGWLL